MELRGQGRSQMEFGSEGNLKCIHSVNSENSVIPSKSQS